MLRATRPVSPDSRKQPVEARRIEKGAAPAMRSKITVGFATLEVGTADSTNGCSVAGFVLALKHSVASHQSLRRRTKCSARSSGLLPIPVSPPLDPCHHRHCQKVSGAWTGPHLWGDSHPSCCSIDRPLQHQRHYMRRHLGHIPDPANWAVCYLSYRGQVRGFYCHGGNSLRLPDDRLNFAVFVADLSSMSSRQ